MRVCAALFSLLLMLSHALCSPHRGRSMIIRDPDIKASWYTGRGIRPVGRFGRNATRRNQQLSYIRASAFREFRPSADTRLHCPEVDVGHVLQGPTSAYSVLDFIGEGSFGRVAKCQNINSKQTVALKILKDRETFKDMEKEVSLLQELCFRDPLHSNVVQLVEHFECMGLYCLAFEMLDLDLYTFMAERNYLPLFTSEIRPIAQQMLVALDFLKGFGILHCDIKPDNVMFTNLQDQPLRVKLIDFGQAMENSEIQQGMTLQPYGYRAPEVSIGFPFTEAVDVWGLGCVLAYLFLGDDLFPINCEYQMVKCAVDLLGFPEDHLLQTGKYTKCFFAPDQSAERSSWRLLTPEEYSARNRQKAQEREGYFEFPSSLDGLLHIHPELQAANVEDKKAFVDLLKGLLHLSGEQRLTPRQALQHPFVTMSHLKEAKLLGFLMISEEFMQICPEAKNSSSSDLLCVSNDATAITQLDTPKTSAPISHDSGVGSLEDEDFETWSVEANQDEDSEDLPLSETEDEDFETRSVEANKDEESEDLPLSETEDEVFETWSVEANKDEDSEAWSLSEPEDGDLEDSSLTANKKEDCKQQSPSKTSKKCDETSSVPARLHCLEVNVGHVLQGPTSAYSVLDFIGEGSFGRVAKCQNINSKQTVALKILKDHKTFKDMEKEVSLLQELCFRDPLHSNVVQLVEHFECMGLYCLAFEMLDLDLYTFMEDRNYLPLFTSEIRPIAQQMLVALDFLKGLGIVHCDIKPDNVMFTNRQNQPLRVKLIDFGQARKVSETHQGMKFQPLGYRAPEVSFGFPFTEAVDVWGLGCVLAYLYLGDNPFPIYCEYQMVKSMVDLLGFPENHLLQTGKHTQCFFTQDQSAQPSSWRLLTPEEYTATNKKETQKRQAFFNFPRSLDGLIHIHAEIHAAKIIDKKAFVDLLKGLLHLSGEQRLTPRQALQHPFVTMSHLKEARLLRYLMISEEFMEICPKAKASLPCDQGAEDGGFKTWSLDTTQDGNSVVWALDSTKNEASGNLSLSDNRDTDSTAALWCSEGDHAQPSKITRRLSLRRIRRFFRRVKDAFTSCVRRQEED